MTLARYSSANLLAATALVVLVAGCDQTKVIPVDDFANVQAPAEGKVGQPVPVTATFILGGCQDAGEMSLMVDHPSKLVAVTGTVVVPPTSGFLGMGPSRSCPAAIGYAQRQAAFTPTGAGIYKVVCKLYPAEGQGPYDRLMPAISANTKGPIEAILDVAVTE